MKKILFISIIIFILTSCKDQTDKYKVGDIVYLKPDSTVAVINTRANWNNYYFVLVPKSNQPVFGVAETSIYGKKK